MSEKMVGYRIKDIEESQRPRERLEKHGAHVLNNAELLAILLRVGMQGASAVDIGHRLLQKFGGLANLQQATFIEMCQVEGVGPAKAAQIKAAIELGARISKIKPEEKTLITCPEDAARLVQFEMAALEQEELWLLLLDSRNQHMRTEKLYRGSLNSSTVRPAEIFKSGIRHNAASLILVHNHPSGDPSPSPDDVRLTKMLITMGETMEMHILDHIIVGIGKTSSIKSLYPDLWQN